MKKILLVALILLGFSTSALATENCVLKNPLSGIRSVGPGWTVYKESIFPWEVKILTREGVSTCMIEIGNGVTLLLPKGFNPEKEHQGVSYDEVSRVQKGNESYPIVSEYSLMVLPAPETKLVYLPEKRYRFEVESPLKSVNTPKRKEDSSFCEWKCKTGIVAVAFWATWRLVKIYDQKKADTATTTGPGPVNPSPMFFF